MQYNQRAHQSSVESNREIKLQRFPSIKWEYPPFHEKKSRKKKEEKKVQSKYAGNDTQQMFQLHVIQVQFIPAIHNMLSGIRQPPHIPFRDDETANY